MSDDSDFSEISECDTAIAAASASFVIATDTSRNELEHGKGSISPREMTTHHLEISGFFPPRVDPRFSVWLLK